MYLHTHMYIHIQRYIYMYIHAFLYSLTLTWDVVCFQSSHASIFTKWSLLGLLRCFPTNQNVLTFGKSDEKQGKHPEIGKKDVGLLKVIDGCTQDLAFE